jgi:hypothetical protein
VVKLTGFNGAAFFKAEKYWLRSSMEPLFAEASVTDRKEKPVTAPMLLRAAASARAGFQFDTPNQPERRSTR